MLTFLVHILINDVHFTQKIEKKSFVIARLYEFSSNSIFDFACMLLVVRTVFFLSFSSAVVVIVDETGCVLMKSNKKIEKKDRKKKPFKYEHGSSWRHNRHRKKRFNIICNITDTISQ